MRDTFSRILALVALALAAGTAVFFFRETRQKNSESIDEELALYRQVRELVKDHYVDDVRGDELIRDAMKGLVSGLDPYSQYYDRREKQRLQEENSGRFVGIGIIIETTQPTLTILFPHPGSPAEKAGLQVGDRIIAINGESIENVGSEIAREKIRGEEGSEVTLTVIPAGSGIPKEIKVQRQSLRDPTVSKVAMLDSQRGIGYLFVSGFSLETIAEFDQAVEKLQKEGMKSLIVDLRFNPGGVLDAAVTITNRFLKEGVIVSTRGRDPQFTREHRAKPEECRYSGLPLVVLLNGETASASEVFAGAIQDYRLGSLIGLKSYGKGVVQSLKMVDHGQAVVKLTTSYYYTPSNRNFEKTLSHGNGGGIEPDLIAPISRSGEDALRRASYRYDIPEKYRGPVEELRNQRGLAPEEKIPDPQLDTALAVLRGETPSLLIK